MLFVALAIAVDINTLLFQPRIGFVTSTGEHWGEMLIAGLLVAPAILGTGYGGLPRRLLATRLLTWLGLVSYGIYLWHDNLMYWLIGRGILNHGFPPLLVLTAATVVVAVTCGAISWYVLERPLRRFVRARLPYRLARVPPSGTATALGDESVVPAATP